MKTFALFCVRNELLKQFRNSRRSKRLGRHVSLDAPLFADDEPETMHDIVGIPPSQETALEQKRRAQQIRSLVGKLPYREREIVRRATEDDAVLRDLATDLGVSFQRVGQLKIKALKQLRKGLKDVA